MALKRQHDMMAMFSMASMTDVIFLLLIFFMITSTFVFPTALEVNLPQSTVQTALKPGTRVYIDKDGNSMPLSATRSLSRSRRVRFFRFFSLPHRTPLPTRLS